MEAFTNGHERDDGEEEINQSFSAADEFATEHEPAPSAWPRYASAALYGLAGEFARLVGPHTEADLIALLVQFIVAFGNAVGRSLYAMADGAKHSLWLNALIIGVSSKARKGSAWNRVKQFFQLVDPAWANNDHIRSGLTSGEGLVWHVRDPIYKRDELDDKGITDKRLLLVETEFASVLRVLGREGNTLSM
jgi:hypothetical protein